MSSDEKPHNNKITKWSNIIISVTAVIALVLSSITAYYQFFRESHNLKALVTGEALESSNAPLEDTFTINVSFINKGTQDTIVSKVSLIFPLKLSESQPFFVELPWYGHGAIVIKPGEVILKKAEFVYLSSKDKVGIVDLSLSKSVNTNEMDEKAGKSTTIVQKGVNVTVDLKDKSFFDLHSPYDVLSILEQYGKKESGDTVIDAIIRFTLLNSLGEIKTVDFKDVKISIRNKSVFFFHVQQNVITLIP